MFLFKQKTAYEMRISDWSSDVCSSDLTWVRTSETRFATWDEFEDLDGPEPLWRLSPERMKMTREHLVPLSRQVVELLRRRRRETNGDFVFPGAKHGKPISENTMIYACYLSNGVQKGPPIGVEEGPPFRII